MPLGFRRRETTSAHTDPNSTMATVGLPATEMHHRSNRHCEEAAAFEI